MSWYMHNFVMGKKTAVWTVGQASAPDEDSLQHHKRHFTNCPVLDLVTDS